MKNTLRDLVERTVWTFAQAFVGTLVATNVASGTVNWREVLVSSAVAGIVAVLKVLGVSASQVNTVVTTAQAVAQAPVVEAAVKAAESVPTVKNVVEKVAASPVVETSEDVARQVANSLLAGK